MSQPNGKPEAGSGLKAARNLAAQINGLVVRVDHDTAIRFRVLEEAIDLDALRQEREALRDALEQPPERDADLLAMAKEVRQAERKAIQDRLAQVERAIGN